MKKTLFILAIVLCGAGMLFAQPKPIKGFVSAGTTTLGDASFGMPLAGITPSTSYTVTSALPFAHLLKVYGEATVMGGEDYVDEYFSFTPATIADAGMHHTYVHPKAPKNYDVSATLKLTVIPCGPGVNAEYPGGNSYESVPVAGYCWTKANLKEEVTGARVYDDQTDASFIDKYGRLYTWYQAVSVADDGSVMPTPDINTGFIKGICPDGWHIPTGVEMTALRGEPAPALNATTDWTGTHASDNTNASGFTAYPAGFYNSSNNRYEGLGSQTDWWSALYTSNAGITTVKVTEIAYYCDAPMEKEFDASNGLSVRCVKDHD